MNTSTLSDNHSLMMEPPHLPDAVFPYDHPLEFNSSGAGSNDTQLPLDMTFNDGHKLKVIVYSILMVISAVGNVTILILLNRKSSPKTRINTMLIHLAIADLMVTLIMMPMEIAWSLTVYWRGGDALCRIMQFLRTFGLYLSSFVLMCISIDRYYAVLRPLQANGGELRCRVMLGTAWVASAICSIPQAIIFSVRTHPTFKWYTQCITDEPPKRPAYEPLYSMANMALLYGIPLLTIIFCYTSILREIARRAKEASDERMRRSSLGFLGRAHSRTLKMTITIVLVFIICWTPYYALCLWFFLFPSSYFDLDYRLRHALFLFACGNSCMNPMVYGAFNVRPRHRRQGGGSYGRSVEMIQHSWRNNRHQISQSTISKSPNGKKIVTME